MEDVKTTKIDRQRTGLSGELFAAAELAKRGYTVSITFGNTKSIDLLVEKNGRTLAIQVKTISHRKSGNWPLPFDELRISENVPFIFVLLNEIGSPPSFFIMNREQFLKESRPFPKSQRRALYLSMAKPFENHWHVLDDALQRDSIA